MKHLAQGSVLVRGVSGELFGECFAYDVAGTTVLLAWLFSRRSGPFWQKVGFASADRNDLLEVLAPTHQVQPFAETGQTEREVAWSRLL